MSPPPRKRNTSRGQPACLRLFLLSPHCSVTAGKHIDAVGGAGGTVQDPTKKKWRGEDACRTEVGCREMIGSEEEDSEESKDVAVCEVQRTDQLRPC